MDTLKLLATAYRQFLLGLGQEFKRVRDEKDYEGFADTFIDAVKSPEIGFTVAEVNALIKMYDRFSLLEAEDLPSHHAMKLMVGRAVDMALLEDAKTLSLSDFKERIKDDELKSQDRTYRYEIMKRTVETGNLSKVYGEELEEAKRLIANQN
jgi:hypothetical protein